MRPPHRGGRTLVPLGSEASELDLALDPDDPRIAIGAGGHEAEVDALDVFSPKRASSARASPESGMSESWTRPLIKMQNAGAVILRPARCKRLWRG
jgi:hypothetical protein